MGGNSGRKKKSRRLAARAAKPTTEQVDQGQYAEIASEDDEMISQAILEWSGLKPVWDRYELSRLFNFGGAIAFEHAVGSLPFEFVALESFLHLPARLVVIAPASPSAPRFLVG